MQEQQRHQGFAPIINSNSKILILGTLPGPEALASGEYYKNPRNAFWCIIFALAGLPITEDYEEKRRVLLTQRLSLWDVYEAAEREGAADNNIANAIVNDFRSFFKEYPNIEGIIFNGQKAEKCFKKVYREEYIRILHKTAWSTSGACAKTFKDKLENWRTAILHF